MFGLTNLFAAIKRLTSAVNESASLFEGANDQLRQRLAVEIEDPSPTIPALPSPNGTEEERTNPVWAAAEEGFAGAHYAREERTKKKSRK